MKRSVDLDDSKQLPTTVSGQKQRILDAFETQIARSSLRSVTMSGLAKELGISTKTLYAEFPTRDELVSALVQKWVDRWIKTQREGMELGLPGMARATRLILLWVEMSKVFKAESWRELGNSHPEILKRVETVAINFSNAAKENMRNEFRADVDIDLAMDILFQIIRRVTLENGFNSNRMTLLSALTQTMAIWARGCLKPKLTTD